VRVHRSEAETLDGCRSGGYSAQAAQPTPQDTTLCLQHVYIRYHSVANASALQTRPPQAARLQHVPIRYRSVANATLQGVECPPTSDAGGSAGFEMPDQTKTAGAETAPPQGLSDLGYLLIIL
jgi:hypothetical protein